jgi:hypothetical protein
VIPNSGHTSVAWFWRRADHAKACHGKRVSAGTPFAKCLRARGRLVSLPHRMVRRKNSSDQHDAWLPAATLSTQSHTDAAHCICGVACATWS